MRMNGGRVILVFASFLLLLMELSACGVLEMGIESATTPIAPTVTAVLPTIPPPTAENVPNEQTAVLPSIPPNLQVVYTKDGDIWLWATGSKPVALTNSGDVDDVRISDDGQRIAFARGDALWVINGDGTDERQLVSVANLKQIAPSATAVSFRKIAWLPQTHTLLFDTDIRFDVTESFANQDLWAVGADTGEITSLLGTGAGGDFVPAPDGSQIAIITTGSIEILSPDGGDRRTIFTYTPVIAYGDSRYFAKPVWSPDAASLYVAIPPADALTAGSQQLTTVWQIFPDGNDGRYMGTIPAAFSLRSAPIFASDVSRVAYLVGNNPNSLHPAIAPLGEEVGEHVIYSEKADRLTTLSADGKYFVFAPPYNGLPTRHIGTLDKRPLQIADADVAVLQVSWIDNTHYLFLKQNTAGWELTIGETIGETQFVIDNGGGSSPAYGFLVRDN